MRDALKSQQRESRQQAAAKPGAAEQAFEDGYRFLENDWSEAAGGKDRKREEPSPTHEAADLQGLSEWKAFGGLALDARARKDAGVDRAQAKTVKKQALAPLGDKGMGQVIPTLLTPPASPPR